MRIAAALITLCFLSALPIGSASAAVDIDWVTVGSPINACDPKGVSDCFGAVSYEYRIGRHEVTNDQYAEFLNSVASTDTNGLYNTNMGTAAAPGYGGIEHRRPVARECLHRFSDRGPSRI